MQIDLWHELLEQDFRIDFDAPVIVQDSQKLLLPYRSVTRQTLSSRRQSSTRAAIISRDMSAYKFLNTLMVFENRYA